MLGVKGIQVPGNRKNKGPEEGCSCVPEGEQEGQHAWSGDRSEGQGEPHHPALQPSDGSCWSSGAEESNHLTLLSESLSHGWVENELHTGRWGGRRPTQ